MDLNRESPDYYYAWYVAFGYAVGADGNDLHGAGAYALIPKSRAARRAKTRNAFTTMSDWCATPARNLARRTQSIYRSWSSKTYPSKRIFPGVGMNLEANMTQTCTPINFAVSQQSKAAALLARSFQNDPLFRYVIPHDGRRAKTLSWLFGRVVYYALLYGQVYTTPAIEGTACWLPPGQAELTFGRVIRTGLQAIVCKLGPAAYRRYDNNQRYLNRIHKCYAPEHHWYLWAIGVDPLRQGKGLGGELVRPVLASANVTQPSCFLETHNEKNVRFYEKHGLRVMSEGNVPKGGPPVWAMLREPQ
jgi:ribosomal protein S18 acetylase RimI-like enzyme